MDFASYRRLTFTRDGRILTVALSNGPVNAVDPLMHEELSRVWADLQRDPESDIIVLTGAGDAFYAGGDMDWFQDMIDHPENFRAILPEGKRIVFDLLSLDKPVICRLNGHAAGLGATIALMCDIIIADDRAKIGDPHVRVGLVAGDGGAVIWPQLIGFAKAKELLMTGDMVPATEAAAMGLINYAVPGAELDAKVAWMTGKLQANPRWAVRWTKVSTNIALRDLATRIMDASVAYETVSNMTEDRREAVKAFAEKRKPRFTGE